MYDFRPGEENELFFRGKSDAVERARVLIACGEQGLSAELIRALNGVREGEGSDLVESGRSEDHCEVVQTLSLLHSISLHKFDVIFTAASLPDATAIDVLAYVRGTVPDMPVIVVGQTGDIDLAAETVRCGAVEFLLGTGHETVTVPLALEKAFAHRVLRRENEQLQESLSRSMSELAVTNRKLERSIQQLEITARTDELTGLVNRRWLNLMLEGRWAEAQRHDLSLGFMMIDLDGFKHLNDSLGHQRGDEVLKAVGELLQRVCREIDVPARLVATNLESYYPIPIWMPPSGSPVGSQHVSKSAWIGCSWAMPARGSVSGSDTGISQPPVPLRNWFAMPMRPCMRRSLKFNK